MMLGLILVSLTVAVGGFAPRLDEIGMMKSSRNDEGGNEPEMIPAHDRHHHVPENLPA